jgi:hypothetical protein
MSQFDQRTVYGFDVCITSGVVRSRVDKRLPYLIEYGPDQFVDGSRGPE